MSFAKYQIWKEILWLDFDCLTRWICLYLLDELNALRSEEEQDIPGYLMAQVISEVPAGLCHSHLHIWWYALLASGHVNQHFCQGTPIPNPLHHVPLPHIAFQCWTCITHHSPTSEHTTHTTDSTTCDIMLHLRIYCVPMFLDLTCVWQLTWWLGTV